MSGILPFAGPHKGSNTGPGGGHALPPDRRWQRAVTLVREGRRPTRRDDALVRQAYQYVKWLRCANPRRSLPTRLRHIQLAHELRTSDNHFGIALEARALAGDAPEPLAASFAMPRDLPTVFEQLFFDVRDKLDDRAYIYEHEIRPDLESDSEKAQDAALYKTVAYEFGWRVFEAVLLANALPGITLLPGQDTRRTSMLRALGMAARRVWLKTRKKDGPTPALLVAIAMIRSNLSGLEDHWDKVARGLPVFQL